MQNLQSALGVLVLLAFAFAISENRRAVSPRRVGMGLAVSLVLAVLFLKVPFITSALGSVNHAIDAVSAASRAGTSFVFGYIGGGPLPFELKFPGNDFVLAFTALPIVLLMSVLTTLLFYWGILPPVVKGFAWALNRTMGVGGAVGLSTAANIFVGHVEAPLFIRPYLAKLSRSELFVVMTGGMAGIAGTVLVLYAQFLRDAVPDAAGHLIIASVLGAPIAVMIGQIMVPDESNTRTDSLDITEPVSDSTMDAIAQGTTAGLALLLNMIAMLIVFVALVHLVNTALGLLPAFGGEPVTLQRMLGLVMAPVCWLIGIPWAQAPAAGALMGIKTVLNELIAYLELSKLPAGALDPRSRLIMLYAMCGFANFGSLGIMIGGLTVMAPERRADILSLGMKSIVSGTLTTLLMGAIVGLLN
ncbi:MAG: nucleoside:proton symporter [Alphaproteobacteria bacterium]|nr:nucleoside:proton symporter [Alphaproteobacteria bacterium]